MIGYLGTFLSNCANQFAFARVLRIYHGVLSPSNISFDGRWLDLTNISFVDAGVNYKEGQELTSFYDEAEVALKIIDEFIYTYTKYNRTEFNIKPLVDYYHEELGDYIAHYIARFIGICHDWLGDYKTSKSYLDVVDEVSRLFFSNQKPVIAAPTGFCVDDPAVCLLKQVFCALSDVDAEQKDELYESFSDVFEHAFRSAGLVCAYHGFVALAAIQSLKKAQFSSFFTRGRIVAQLLALVKNMEPEGFEGYIEDYIDVAKWLFEEGADVRAILFRSSWLELRYDADEEKYSAVTNHSTNERFHSARTLRDWIEGRGERAFFIDNYDFRPGLLQMLVILEDLEKLKTSNDALWGR